MGGFAGPRTLSREGKKKNNQHTSEGFGDSNGGLGGLTNPELIKKPLSHERRKQEG